MARTLKPKELAGKVYLGKIVDNNDPDQEGRCKINVFGVFDDLSDEELPWANPSSRNMFAGGDGGFANISVPKVGSIVQVKFVEGQIYSIEYTTIQNFNKAVQAEISDSYLNSHVIAYDVDEEMKIFYTPGKGLNLFHKDSQIIINPDSSITIEHKGTESIIELVGSKINIVSREEVNITTKKVVIDHTDIIELGAGASERLVLGDSFQGLFNNHIHIGNAGLPTSPPIAPMLDTFLSGRFVGKPIVKTV